MGFEYVTVGCNGGCVASVSRLPRSISSDGDAVTKRVARIVGVKNSANLDTAPWVYEARLLRGQVHTRSAMCRSVTSSAIVDVCDVNDIHRRTPCTNVNRWSHGIVRDRKSIVEHHACG